MTGCDYCARLSMGLGDVMTCAGCGALACALCSAETEDGILCYPDPNTWPGRGCYKPPVAEVAE